MRVTRVNATSTNAPVSDLGIRRPTACGIVAGPFHGREDLAEVFRWLGKFVHRNRVGRDQKDANDTDRRLRRSRSDLLNPLRLIEANAGRAGRPKVLRSTWREDRSWYVWVVRPDSAGCCAHHVR